MYVLINKSQLNNDVNSKVIFQKMRIPLFMFYLKFSCGHHTNPKLSILWDFAAGFLSTYSFFSFFTMRFSKMVNRDTELLRY